MGRVSARGSKVKFHVTWSSGISMNSVHRDESNNTSFVWVGLKGLEIWGQNLNFGTYHLFK